MGNAETTAFHIGIMSGTSLDGVDAVVLESGQATTRIRESCSIPIPDQIRTEALDLVHSDRDSLNRACRLASRMTGLYATAVRHLLDSFSGGTIGGIGCHGQTLRHFPQDPETPFTIQAVNGAMLAELSGLPCVTDFRSADLALGGQGAPLAPAFHAHCFRSDTVDRVILNLGGVANITMLPANTSHPVTGFDTGPANALMDLWAQRHIGKPFDEDGLFASSGRAIAELTEEMLADDYFRRPPPKSTGREYFGWEWIQQCLKSRANPRPGDVQATLLEVTASSVVTAIREQQPTTREVYVCGGGHRNAHLMSRIRALLGDIRLSTTEDLGIAPNLVEASAFAWLASRRIQGLPGNLPSVTGASRPAVLGALYIP
jgi:anhydro-N-acetylmuramic acid kinase